MKRLLLLFLLLPRLALGFPVNGVLDTFTGNAQPVGGIWSDDLFQFGLGCEKTGGYLTKDVGSGADVGCWVTEPFAARQEVYAEIFDHTAWTDNVTSSLLLCISSPGVVATLTGYGVRFQKRALVDRFEAIRIDGVVFTQFGASIEYEAATGDDFGIETLATAGDLELWIKDGAAAWASLGTRSESGTPLNCTNTHIGANPRSTVARFDQFGGGTTVSPVAAGNPFIRLLLR